MCGIIGYTGFQEAEPILLEGLRRLEYRGYDSAGMATVTGDRMHVRKCAGRIARFVQRATIGDGTRMRAAQRLLPPLAAWTKHRDLPPAPKRSFRDTWPDLERESTVPVDPSIRERTR